MSKLASESAYRSAVLIALAAAGTSAGCDPENSADEWADDATVWDSPVDSACNTPGALREGLILTLTEEDDFPCELIVRSTGTALQSDAEGTVPDPWRVAAVDSRGLYYTATYGSGEVAVWNHDGTFRRVIGRVGKGPGEFAPGPVNVFVDAADSLHARDNGMTWSVFDPQHRFVRRVGSRNMGGISDYTAILDDGTIVTGQTVAARNDVYFVVADRSGNPLRGFAPIEDLEARRRPDLTLRRLSYAGGDAFWASPPEAAAWGYELELWSSNGDLKRTIRRDVSWFPWRERSQLPPRVRRETAAPEKPPSAVRLVHVDSAGLVLTIVRVTTDRWRWIPDRRKRQERGIEFFDFYCEVFDPVAGLVLASRKVRASRQLPIAFFPGRRLGYRLTEVDAGTQKMELLEYRLVSARSIRSQRRARTGT